MIEGNKLDGFELCCDYCGDSADELFDTFQDAVDYKVDRENGWASVKGKDGEWQELCPSCNTPETIAKVRGINIPDNPRNDTDAAKLALKALEEG